MVKNLPANVGDTKRCQFDLWVWKIPWRRKRQPTLVFLPGKSHQKSLEDYSPWGHKRVGQYWARRKEHTIALHCIVLSKFKDIFKLILTTSLFTYLFLPCNFSLFVFSIFHYVKIEIHSLYFYLWHFIGINNINSLSKNKRKLKLTHKLPVSFLL